MRSFYWLVLVLGLAGCGGTEFAAPEIDEIPPGPGLFTGEDGALVIGLP